MKKELSAMTLKEFLLRVLAKLPVMKGLAQKTIVYLAKRPGSRRRVNDFYLNLKGDEVALFQSVFAKAFTQGDDVVKDGAWDVDFGSATLKLPLRSGRMWLDWDNAVSITGHDHEVKATYASLLRSRYRPRVFFDVGANYGTHSLLFLANGVRAISFEPNPSCQVEFAELCKLNGVEPEPVGAAVGDRSGEVEYVFPERDTWLGSIVDSTKEELIAEHEVQRLRVEMTTIDEFVSAEGVTPDLIKIDTEGNELNVLHGAAETIRRARPMIIFEANRLADRQELWDALDEHDNVICDLPVSFETKAHALSESDFMTSTGVNFLSLAKEHACVDQGS